MSARARFRPDPLEAAQQRQRARLPFFVGDAPAGSVALDHLPWLQQHAPWLTVSAQAITLDLPAPQRDEALGELHQRLRHDGLLLGWRDEIFPIWDIRTGAVLARIERCAARFWGSLTRGAHCNGYVADDQGRPQRLWVARRSPHKSTDPNRLDNLVGGGVPHGQTPHEALVREAWEEAGLRPEQVATVQSHGIVELHRDIPEGCQWEWLYVYDLPLSAQVVPQNQDGEVAEFFSVDANGLLEVALSGEMTVDAAVVSLDFAWRHQWVPPHLHDDIGQRLARLLRTPNCTPLRA